MLDPAFNRRCFNQSFSRLPGQPGCAAEQICFGQPRSFPSLSLNFHPFPHTKMPKRKLSIECQDNDLKDNHVNYNYKQQELRTFERLPDEILWKIFKMSVSPKQIDMWYLHGGCRDDIVKLSQVSSRFSTELPGTGLYGVAKWE